MLPIFKDEAERLFCVVAKLFSCLLHATSAMFVLLDVILRQQLNQPRVPNEQEPYIP
jgi:hypothetical protein